MRIFSMVLALALPVLAPAAWAQSLIGHYTAFIGWEDLHNSNGQRLTEPWQIVRQDRANYHRFGIRQHGDEGDPFFALADNRALLERLVMQSGLDPYTRAMILQGNVTIVVEVYGSPKAITRVRVQVPG